MNRLRILTLLASCAAFAQAESLNVIHLGPPRTMEFEVKSGELHQKFTLARAAATGRFTVPSDAKTGLESLADPKIAVTLPPSKESRLAVFHPAGDSFVWRTFPARPTEGKHTLRVISLATEEVSIAAGERKLTIPAGAEVAVDPPANRLTTPDGRSFKVVKNDEPGAMIAFLIKSGETWEIHFIADT